MFALGPIVFPFRFDQMLVVSSKGVTRPLFSQVPSLEPSESATCDSLRGLRASQMTDAPVRLGTGLIEPYKY